MKKILSLASAVVLLSGLYTASVSCNESQNTEQNPNKHEIHLVSVKDEVADMVRRYELQEMEGTGLVIIGELLDKSTYMGTFIVIYFDIASREVLHGQGMTGKARGFGLRNYWAGALYDALKGLR